MNAHTPIDPAARDLANEIMKRLDALALTLTNARGFRVWIEELHSRDLSVVKPPHVDAIHMTRAGMLRAAITSIMAALDTKSRDRASVGQIIHMLEELDLSTLAYRWPHAGFGAATLQQAKADWQAILQGPDYSDCKAHRDNMVAHTLMLATPVIENQAFFRLHDAAERVGSLLFDVCGYGRPSFVAQKAGLATNAKVFWDTYWRGMLA